MLKYGIIVLSSFHASAIWMNEAIEMTVDSCIVQKHWPMATNAAIFTSQKFNPIMEKIPPDSFIETRWYFQLISKFHYSDLLHAARSVLSIRTISGVAFSMKNPDILPRYFRIVLSYEFLVTTDSLLPFHKLRFLKQ